MNTKSLNMSLGIFKFSKSQNLNKLITKIKMGLLVLKMYIIELFDKCCTLVACSVNVVFDNFGILFA